MSHNGQLPSHEYEYNLHLYLITSHGRKKRGDNNPDKLFKACEYEINDTSVLGHLTLTLHASFRVMYLLLFKNLI